jgi:hypothetical protein
MKEKIAPVIEYVAESTTACLVTMVQGNVLALTLGHLIVASETGVIAGAIAGAALFVSRADKRWMISVVLGVATAVVDFYVHPGMFGAAATEAIVTGIAAGLLSYAFGSLVQHFRKKPAPTA